MVKRKKVVVAMSGGVDSSVAAAVLKDEGFEVIGITMQFCGINKAEDAKKVADKLKIPHYALDLSDTFEEKVITDFCSEYRQGRTPNPCIKCNKYIKFGALLKEAHRLGADCVASGHYARIEFDRKNKKFLLKKGIDSQKDQSYFLYMLSQEQLSQILMPLGNLTKEKVREIAREKDLPVLNNLESQEICFIRDEHYADFLKDYIPEGIEPGPIVDKENRVIGRHRGIIFYTIGQRKGIGIAAKEPLYVTSIEKETNAVVVAERNHLYSDELIAENVHFIDGVYTLLKAETKVRYLHPGAKATIVASDNNRVKVKFDRPQWAVTPGQAAVFFKGDVVIGGGTISRC